MASGRKGTFVVGIRNGDVNPESIKTVVSRIHGVSDVEFNYLTHKFTVHYNGAPDTLEKIKEKLKA